MTASVVRFTLGALLLLALAPSVAVADRPFAKRFGTNDLGNITIAGNTLMTCPSHCAAENGVGSGAALNDNNYQMVRVDTDGDPATIDSSSATLDVPAGATVLWAGLYWGADTSAAGTGTAADATRKGAVKLAVPGGSGYTTVTSSQTDTVGTATRASRPSRPPSPPRAAACTAWPTSRRARAPTATAGGRSSSPITTTPPRRAT